ncbi:RHS repeat protein [Alcanivorax hongdengensis]
MWRYSYDASGNITSVVNPYGGQTSISYDTQLIHRFDADTAIYNKVVTQLHEAGRKTLNYSYSRGDDGDITTVDGDLGTTVYHFDGLGSVSDGEVWRIGLLKKKVYTPATGAESVHEYHYARKPISTENMIRRIRVGFNIPEDEYYYIPILTSETFTLGGDVWEKTYNTNIDQDLGDDSLVEFSPYDVLSIDEVGPAGSRHVLNSYYSDPGSYVYGRVEAEGGLEGPGGDVYENQMSYDSNGNVESIVAKNIEIDVTVDSHGNITSKETPEGLKTEYSSFDKGIPTHIKKPGGLDIDQSVDDFGRVQSRSYAGRTEQTVRDVSGRVLSFQPVAGDETTVDWLSNEARVRRGALKHVYTFDGYGRIISEKITAPQSPTVNISRGYDSQDNLVSLTINGSHVSYSYDGYGRLISINDQGRIRSFNYSGDEVSVTNELGGAITYPIRSYSSPFDYDVMGMEQDGGVSISIGRNIVGSVTDISSGDVERVYDYGGSYFYPVSYTEPETGKTLFSYDNDGRVVGSGFGDGFRTRHVVYDDAGYVSQETYSDGSGDLVIDYSRDILGNILSATRIMTDNDDNSTVTGSSYTYTLDNLVTSETLSIDEQDFTLSYGYDNKRSLISVGYPSGNTYTVGTDGYGNPTSYSGFVDSATYSYVGVPLSISFANGDVYNASVNARRTVSSMGVSAGFNNPLLAFSYVYDDALNITEIVDGAGGNRSMNATYDDFSRLLFSESGGDDYGYVYDELNNISMVSRNGSLFSYHYDENNVFSSVDFYPDAVSEHNPVGEQTYFGVPGSSIELGTDQFQRSYARLPDGSVSRIASVTAKDLMNGYYGSTDFYNYDYRGYMVKEVTKVVDTSTCVNGVCDLKNQNSPVYSIYGNNGRLMYQLDSGTGFKKEYHYLGSRLIGMTSDKYGCGDDPDGDGMEFCYEEQYGLDNNRDDANYDYDNDGLTNLEEFSHHSNPNKKDSDADGIPDGDEVALDLDPAVSDASGDNDGDGLTNYQEYVAGYDPNVANIPDAVSDFSLSVGANELLVRWDRNTSPQAKVLVGTSSENMALLLTGEGGEAALDYGDLPEEGYVAVVAHNNEGDAQPSASRHFKKSSDWGSFSLTGADQVMVNLDQQGLMLVADNQSGYLKAMQDGQLLDQTSLNSYPRPESFDYENGDFKTFSLNNGDYFIVWTMTNARHAIRAARFCVKEGSFCHYDELYSSSLQSGGGNFADTVFDMDAVLLNDHVIVAWRQKLPQSESQVYAVVTDTDLSDIETFYLDDGLPAGEQVKGLGLLATSDDQVLLVRQKCCTDDASGLYLSRWTLISGWSEPQAMPLEQSDGEHFNVDQFSLLAGDTSGIANLVVVDWDSDIARVLNDVDGTWAWVDGQLNLTDATSYQFAATTNDDRLSLAYATDSGVSTYSVNDFTALLQGAPIEKDIDEYIEGLAIQPSLDDGAWVLISTDDTGYLFSHGVSGASVLHELPVSGALPFFVSAANQDQYAAVAAYETSGAVRASVERLQTSQTTPPFIDIDTPESIHPGMPFKLCGQWAVSRPVSVVRLEQTAGPVFAGLPSQGRCTTLSAPLLAQSQQADFSFTVSTAAEDQSGSGSLMLPAFEPSVYVSGPVSVLEGQQADIGVDITYNNGDTYYGPRQVSWVQLSGPQRAMVPENTDGTHVSLWGSNVTADQTAVYQASVYFPDADMTLTAQYSVLIEDSGSTVDLPPDVSLDIQPYSQWGYDMQKVTISTDVESDITLKMYGSWSMLSDGNQPQSIAAGEEPETGFTRRYVGPFSAILQQGQSIQGVVRAESLSSGLVSYYNFEVTPPPVGELDPYVTIGGDSTLPDGDTVDITAQTHSDDSGDLYDGNVQYTWTQLSGPDLGLGAGLTGQSLTVTLPQVQSPTDIVLAVQASLTDEGMSVTAQKTFTVVDDDSSGGNGPTISWDVEPYSAYGYDMNRVTFDAGNADIYMKIYGSWTMLSDGNQPVEVGAGNEPESGYGYQYVAPFSILRESGKQMDITVRAQSADTGVVSYKRIIVTDTGGSSAPLN